MTSFPRPSSTGFLGPSCYGRRMSAPNAVTCCASSASSSPSTPGFWPQTRRYSSLTDTQSPYNYRRRSLAEIAAPRVAASERRKLSLVECSLTCSIRSDSSFEIDTSSLSCDARTAALSPDEVSYVGSYQSIPAPQDEYVMSDTAFFTGVSMGRPVWRALVLGQLMSLILCAMAACNHYLSMQYMVVLPTGQSFLRYALQCLCFTSWLSCRDGERGILHVLKCRGWRYLLLSFLDVEANLLLLTAHQFTTLTSIQLLDCVSIPTSLALSCLVLQVRYKIVHIVGVSLCLMGVGCLVWADIEDGRSLEGGKNQLLGDMLCLGGAVLFAVICVTEEYVVKRLDWVEFLGMMGLFGCLLSAVQVAVVEREAVLAVPWGTWQVGALLAGFSLLQFLFQLCAPALLYDSGATALQLSLLTADFYWLMSGIFLWQYKLHALYFLSFTLTATGIMIYAIKRTPIYSQQAANYSAFCVSFPSSEGSDRKGNRIKHALHECNNATKFRTWQLQERVMPGNCSTAADMELATPVSDLVSSSVCQGLDGSTDTQLAQLYRINGDVTMY